MPSSKSVLIVGFDPKFLDFSSPELAPLNETAETVVAARLRAREYGCVIIGAGIRANPKHFLLFESS